MHHIGIDARLTYYRTGGISTYIRELTAALEGVDHEHRFTVFQSRKARKRLTKRFPSAVLWTPSHHRFERWALSVELTRFGLDLLHSPDFIPPERGARRHVITVHDLTFLHYPQHLTTDARRYYNHQIAWAVRHANHILTDSQSSKRDMIDMLGVPADKITVHLLGVDGSFQPPGTEALKQARIRHDLPQGYILFVGTFEPRKNIAGLLEAYRLLIEQQPDAPPLVLAGTRGWLFDETMAKVETLALGQRVIWRENIPQSEMPALYALASVLVVPSFYEGFGLTALEAMACGTPTIVSSRSSLPEVVGDVGLQIPPEDTQSIAHALEKAVVDQHWREAQRVAGIKRAAEFTWERTAEVTLKVYRQVLAR